MEPYPLICQLLLPGQFLYLLLYDGSGGTDPLNSLWGNPHNLYLLARHYNFAFFLEDVVKLPFELLSAENNQINFAVF